MDKIYGSAVPTQFPYDFALHKCECYIVTYQIILIIIRIHSCRAKFACRDGHDQTSCLGTVSTFACSLEETSVGLLSSWPRKCKTPSL
ncbi:unnamed protein product [Fusarium graminearum]|nr:unnamed protein product [Fusarium graminearum]CAG1960705.1 unnamed protein product [Fusarium graminearum]CAG1974351.1 unnamed protein product [Fusarium graminearum]VTO88989.1 unnamed protein product [Fusarium graminearum]